MVEITDYNSSFIKINDANNDIYFLEKAGLSVSGLNGNLTLTTADNVTRSYARANIKSPIAVTLDQVVVTVRTYIDNV